MSNRIKSREWDKVQLPLRDTCQEPQGLPWWTGKKTEAFSGPAVLPQVLGSSEDQLLSPEPGTVEAASLYRWDDRGSQQDSGPET